LENKFKIKVCGLRDSQNIIDIAGLQIDMLGFIFYEKSPRYAEPVLDRQLVNKISEKIKKTAVFVNSTEDKIIEVCEKFHIDIIQLHGNESSEFCKAVKNDRILIKAFSIDNNFDFSICYKYEKYCEYFLFDSKGENYGGNSIRYNWDLLKKYKGSTSFILSGGIGPEHVKDIKNFSHDKFSGIDINSRFEIEAGLKNAEKIDKFIKNLR